MPILIRRSPEPLSEQSARPGEEGLVYTASSNASRILKHELRRYCDGHIQGRSFLIAGHRGAGKTTMVSDVLTNVIKLSQSRDVALRPLPVMLHGPSLFQALPSDVRAAADKQAVKAGSSATSPASGPAPASTPAPATAPPAPLAPPPGGAPASTPAAAPAKPLDEESKVELQAELALKQIILGLHRAVAREYAAAYRRVLLPEQGVWASTVELSERGELAAQFELELMEDPPASRLRELWEHVGALEEGILFPKGRPADLQQARHAQETFTPTLRVADQGTRELVALNGICNAHQRISGDLSNVANEKDTQGQTSEKTTGVEPKLADALKPVTTVLSAAIVAGGSMAGQLVTWPGALVLGVLAAVASSLVWKRSVTFSGKRERIVDTKFIPDLTVRTLDRVLPTLLERLRTAGLAPVFVIDELDKVDGLSDRIMAMVHYLKKLVAESVFTCFLTDRGYMEFLRLAERQKAYGVAYSYFSHPLLIAHEPGDLDAYLDEMLVLSDTGGARATEDAADKEILKWVLRHRSQMHALKLTRELAALRSDGGSINIPVGTVRRSVFYKIDATLQVAIEYYLNSEALVGWSMQRPNMRQTLFDALYYISREWLSGKPELDLREDQKAVFRRALYKRMNLEEVCIRKQGDAHDGTPRGAEKDLISDDDLKLLFGTVCEMADNFLSGGMSAARIQTTWPRNRNEREGAPKAPRPERPVLDVLMFKDEPPSSFLIRDTKHAGLYKFRYWQSGQERGERTARAPAAVYDEAEQHLLFITTLDQSISELLQPEQGAPLSTAGSSLMLMCAELNVFPQSPPWADANTAHQTLMQARNGQGNPVELEDQLSLVSEFVQMLRGSLDALGPTLLIAACLGGMVPYAGFDTAIVAALRILAKGFGFAALNSTQIQGVLQKFQAHVDRLDDPLPPPPGFSTETGELLPLSRERLLDAWEVGRRYAMSADWAASADRAWTQLEARLAAYERGSKFETAGFDEILCAAHEIGPVKILPLQVDNAPLRAWTLALIGAMRPHGALAPGDRIPFGIVGHALLRSGFGRYETSFIDALINTLQSVAEATPEEGAALRRALSESSAMKREAAPTGAVIFICKKEGSVAEAWTQVPTRAWYLVMTVAQLELELSQQVPSVLPMLPSPILLVWERSDEQDANEATLRAQAGGIRAQFLVLDPNRSQVMSTPKGPDELVTLMRS
jgi:hypothetical protein